MAASRIKGITIELGGDTTKLQNALKGVNSEIKNTQSQLKDVEKLLKLDPGNTELLAQKHRLLKDAVSETKEKLETLKVAAEQANTALANGEISKEQYDALQREIIETENELKRLEEQAGQSATALQKIALGGEKLKSMGDSVTNAGQKLLPVTAGVTALGTAAVKTAADFDSAMSKVAAVSGATGDDLDKLRDKAREMGSKTKFSASEAAEAMNYMAMAGWKTGDMLSGVEGIMNLAAASGEELATTSDIVTDALTAFGLSASDSGHFADVLAAASSNANTNVSMMGESFKYAAPVAGSLGISAEDTSIALGLMANAGIKASQSGTALRTGLTNMAKPTKQMAAYMDKYNISLVENADGSINLRDTMVTLREKMGGLSESEQAAAASAIFGKNAMAGWLAIINASDADFNKLTGAIDTCDGTAEKMATTMQDNLEGQLTILKSQLEELAISFGEMLMPVIREIVTWIQGFVDKLNSMDEGTRKMVITIGLVAAAIGPVLIVIGHIMSAVGTIMTVIPKLASVIGIVQKAFMALNATMLANPIVLIIAAIAALVAAFIYLWNTNEDFRQFWIDLWENIKSIVSTAVEAIKTFFTRVIEFVKNNWQSLLLLLVNPFAGAFKLLYDNCEGFRTFIDNFLTSVKELFTNIWNGIKEVFSTVLEAIKTFVVAYFNFYQTCITTVVEAIRTVITTVWEAIKTAIQTVMSAIQTIYTTVWNAIKTAITTVVNAIKTVIETVWNAIRTAVESVLNAIKNTVTIIWNGIKNAVSSAMNTISSTVFSIWNTIRSTVSSVVEGIKAAVTTGFMNMASGVRERMTNVLSAVQEGFNRVREYITNLASQALQWGRDIISGIVDGIRSCISNVRDAVSDVADTIKSYLHFSVPDEGPLTEYEKWMPDFMKGLAEGIEKSKGLVADAISGVSADMVVNPTVDANANIQRNQTAQTNAIGGIMSDIRSLVNIIGNMNTDGGDIVVPVYIGGSQIDEIVLSAQSRRSLRSGGRA